MTVSIRFIIAVVGALSVALVGAVTLLVTVPSSLVALRQIGTQQVDALLTIANLELVRFFIKSTDALDSVINMTRTTDWDMPNANLSTITAFEWQMYGAFLRAYPDIASYSMIYADNSGSHWVRSPTVSHEFIYRTKIAQDDTVLNTTFNYVERSFDIETQLEIFDSQSEPFEPVAPRLASNSPSNPDLFHAMDGFTTGSFSKVVGPPAVYHEQGHVLRSLIAAAPLYTPSAELAGLRGVDHVFGYVFATIWIDSIEAMLESARGTPGTAVYLSDALGYLLGAAGPNRATSPVYSERPHSTVIPTGCATTDQYYDTPGTPQMFCRAQATQYPDAALNELATDFRDVYRPRAAGKVVQQMTLDGKRVYVASARVGVSFPGLELYVLLLLPEADVIGNVIQSRDTAIGITCALVVIMAGINTVLVWLLLAPLSSIALRMIKASRLEDDEADDSVSAMSEVAELQEAYYAMNDELNRIRAFVPQAVLKQRAPDEEEEEEEEEEVDEGEISFARASTLGGSMSQSATSPKALGGRRPSRLSRGDTSSRVSSRSGIVALRDAPLTERQVTVLIANVSGVHAATGVGAADCDARLLGREIGSAAAALDAAVTPRGGLYTFHGDRFLATFNSSTNCMRHAAKACDAATSIHDALRRRTSDRALSVSLGVATSRCVVGTLGCERVKAMSTVGPAVQQAAALERLSTRFHGCKTLITPRVAAEVGTTHSIRSVDLVSLPVARGVWNAMIVGQIVEPGDATGTDKKETPAPGADDNDEWMYVLEARKESDQAAAKFNPVFDHIVAGRFDDALSLMGELCPDVMADDAESAAAATVLPSQRLLDIVATITESVNKGQRLDVKQGLCRTWGFSTAAKPCK